MVLRRETWIAVAGGRMKTKVLGWLNAIEGALCTRGVFVSLAWLAVTLALISIVFGAKWAAASCALSLAILAHMAVAMVLHASSLANSFIRIQQLYGKEVQGTEKKEPEPGAAQPMSGKIH
jgi:hypothetical protein